MRLRETAQQVPSALPQTRVAVLGGGIAGCTLASELARSGRVSVTLFERAAHLGGLHRSEQREGLVFDIGAFVFDEDHGIFTVFPEVRGAFLRVPNRYGSVRVGGVLDDYPLTLGGVRRQFGSRFVARTLFEILRAKVTRSRAQTVEGFAEYYIGRSLYRVSGLKTYIARLYLAPDASIDVEFATKRMAAVVASAGLRRNIARLAAELVRGHWPRNILRPITADVVWVRPPEGFDAVYRIVEACLKTRGVSIRCGTTLSGIEPTEGRFSIRVAEGDEIFDHVFSTIPLEAAARLLGLEGFTVPEYMDLYSLFYEHVGDPGFPYNVLHNFTETGQWKRATVFSRYYGAVDGKHYFAVEGTVPERAGEQETILAGALDFERWMREHGLPHGEIRRLGGVVTRNAYPVFRSGAARGIERLRQDVQQRGLFLAGRQGSFDYLSSSDAAGDALAVARSFLASLEEPG
jgi:protoporphyrinogen oxidase